MNDIKTIKIKKLENYAINKKIIIVYKDTMCCLNIDFSYYIYKSFFCNFIK